MTLSNGPVLLGLPGPTPIPERVLRAMQRQPLEVYDEDLIGITESCLADLARLMGTAGEPFIYAANGHGAWEAALVNTLAPGEAVLVLESGRFAVDWGQMAGDLGYDVRTLPGSWRRAVDPGRVEEVLRADRQHTIKAVLATQIDTATGVANDIPAIGRAIGAAGHPALFMADVIGSLGSMPFAMDASRVDVTVAGSQKGLMCPPGLSFVGAGPRAMARHAATEGRRHYWDWSKRQRPLHYHRYCGTPPEHLLFALREALDMIGQEGIGAVHERHRILAGAVRRAAEVWTSVPDPAFAFNVTAPAERADTVTVLRTAPGIDPAALCRLCKTRFGMVLGPGIGDLKGDTFRIAHMGHVNAATVLGMVATVELALKTLGWSVGTGGIEAAIDHLGEASGADPLTLADVRAAGTAQQ